MYSAILYYLGLCQYTFTQQRNRLTTHFSELIPVVQRHISVFRLGRAVYKSSAHVRNSRQISNDGAMVRSRSKVGNHALLCDETWFALRETVTCQRIGGTLPNIPVQYVMFL